MYVSDLIVEFRVRFPGDKIFRLRLHQNLDPLDRDSESRWSISLVWTSECVVKLGKSVCWPINASEYSWTPITCSACNIAIFLNICRRGQTESIYTSLRELRYLSTATCSWFPFIIFSAFPYSAWTFHSPDSLSFIHTLFFFVSPALADTSIVQAPHVST